MAQPTPEMRRAMADAVVGDDDYGEDPTVRALEEAFAERLGKPAHSSCRRGPWPTRSPCGSSLRGTVVVAGPASTSWPTSCAAAATRPCSSTRSTTTMARSGRQGTGPVRPAYHHPRSRWSASRTPTWRRGSPWSLDSLREVSRRRAVPVHLDGARSSTRRPRPAWPSSGRRGHDRDVLSVQGAVRAGRPPLGRARGCDDPGPPGARPARRGHAPSGRPRRPRPGGPDHHGGTPPR